MPTKWKLRELLKERGVKSASEISSGLEEIGYQLSVQAVCDLLNRSPKMIRLETIEAICNAFYIPLSEFLEVLPMASQKRQKKMRTLQIPSGESAHIASGDSQRSCFIFRPGASSRSTQRLEKRI